MSTGSVTPTPEAIERARTVGTAVWTRETDGRVTMVDIVTGDRWVRELDGRWRPLRPEPPAARSIVDLLVLGAPAEQITVLLRPLMRPWGEVLDDAAAQARAAGVDVAEQRDQVAALMSAADPTPHKIIHVVTHRDAYVASWYACASMPDAPVWWRDHCRQVAAQAAREGAPETLVGVWPTRYDAVRELAVMRPGQRPGQHWRVEPVTPPAVEGLAG